MCLTHIILYKNIKYKKRDCIRLENFRMLDGLEVMLDLKITRPTSKCVNVSHMRNINRNMIKQSRSKHERNLKVIQA